MAGERKIAAIGVESRSCFTWHSRGNMTSSFLNRLSVRNRIWTIVAVLIGSIVLGSVIDTLMLRKALWHEKEHTTRQLVESAFSVLSHFHRLQEKGELFEAAAQAAAIATIKAMRYDEREYFWLNDLGTPFPKMIMHPTVPALDGQVLDAQQFNCATSVRVGTDGAFTATDGKKNLFVAFVEVVNQGGQGYVTYDWPKPKAEGGATEKLYPKLSYVRKFEPWGWVIGSGIYIDNVGEAVRTQAGGNALLVAGAGIILLLFASLMARSITQPLRLTVSTMRAIGKGEQGLSQRLPVEGNSEIAELARGFNEMLAQLEARSAELARHQESLEDEVARRTAELRDSNQHLAERQTEIEALLRKMEDAQNQILQSEKLAAIGQLAAGVAHEINNPVGFVKSNLAVLTGYVECMLALLDAYGEWECKEPARSPRVDAAKQEADLPFLRQDIVALLAESREGLERVEKIVQNLKDFSHVDESEWQEADLNAGLESTLNVVWNELKYKAEVVREYGDLPRIRCLPGQLNQVFMNLLLNAAQAIEEHGTITLRSAREGDWIRIDIADTGHGMPPEVQKRVFEPFFTTKPVGKGTGLGLSLAYDIVVKKHGGRLELFSEPGEGTTFRIWLPVRGGGVRGPDQ